jgi:hypothetical protein
MKFILTLKGTNLNKTNHSEAKSSEARFELKPIKNQLLTSFNYPTSFRFAHSVEASQIYFLLIKSQ